MMRPRTSACALHSATAAARAFLLPLGLLLASPQWQLVYALPRGARAACGAVRSISVSQRLFTHSFASEPCERPRVGAALPGALPTSKIGAGASASRGQASVASIDPFVT